MLCLSRPVEASSRPAEAVGKILPKQVWNRWHNITHTHLELLCSSFNLKTLFCAWAYLNFIFVKPFRWHPEPCRFYSHHADITSYFRFLFIYYLQSRASNHIACFSKANQVSRLLDWMISTLSCQRARERFQSSIQLSFDATPETQSNECWPVSSVSSVSRYLWLKLAPKFCLPNSLATRSQDPVKKIKKSPVGPDKPGSIHTTTLKWWINISQSLLCWALSCSGHLSKQ